MFVCEKYIIKIFDYTLISIAPYDGNYEEDIEFLNSLYEEENKIIENANATIEEINIVAKEVETNKEQIEEKNEDEENSETQEENEEIVKRIVANLQPIKLPKVKKDKSINEDNKLFKGETVIVQDVNDGEKETI